jgi:uncharacterized membrane-anchored protein YhcB (DUF1043 family)
MTTFTTDQWVILGLLFVLGLLVGTWMTSGGRRKWKTRYNNEVTERKALETRLKEREAHFATQEKEWRETESRHQAALQSRPVVDHDRRQEPFAEDRMRDRHPSDRHPGDRPAIGRGDMDRDGIPDNRDRGPLDDRR